MKITKKSRLEACRNLIDKNQIDVYFNDSDTEQLAEILQHDIAGAIRRKNPQFPSDPRHLHTLIDGVWDGRSWRKMIEQTATPESEAKRVMRHLISQDMREFMDSMDHPFCLNCFVDENLTVDHVKPPFSEIANEFIKEHGLPEIQDNPDPNTVVKQFADFDMEAKWVHFHSENAAYQILCRSCNASKGNK